MKTARDLPPQRLYNISGRAYPDVAAAGMILEIIIGQIYLTTVLLYM